MNNVSSYIRPTIFFSAIIGLILGVLLLVPIVQLFLVFAFWAVGGVILFMLKKQKFIKNPVTKDAIIIGILSGIVSVIFASIIFLPLSFLLSLFIKNYFLHFTFSLSLIFVVLMIIFLTALFNVIFNILSTLAVAAFINGSKINVKEMSKFKIE